MSRVNEMRSLYELHSKMKWGVQKSVEATEVVVLFRNSKRGCDRQEGSSEVQPMLQECDHEREGGWRITMGGEEDGEVV